MPNENSVKKFFDLSAAGPDESESEDENDFGDFLASQNSEFSIVQNVRKRVREDSDDELQVEVEVGSQDTVIDDDVVPCPPDDQQSGVRITSGPLKNRSRGWCFTINNWTDVDCRKLAEFFDDNPNCTYLVYGKEVGKQGTPHLQGYLHCKHARAGLAVRHAIGDRGHWEAAKGSPQANRAYCSKQTSESNPLVEMGRCPQQGRSADLATLTEAFCKGVTPRQLRQEERWDEAATYIKHQRGLAAFLFESAPRRDPDNEVTVWWCYGPTGSGKSRWAHETFPDAYYHPMAGKWFDGYRGEAVVIFDDFRPDKELTYHWILGVIDRYAKACPVKGAFTELQATTFVFTTPEKPENTFFLNEDIGQLTRRIGPNIKRFGDQTHSESREAQLNTNVFGN